MAPYVAGLVSRRNSMQRKMLSITALVSLMVMANGCGTSSNDSMNSKKDNKAGGGLESDPRLYKLNSVMGAVKSGGKAVPGATVTIVSSQENFPVGTGGSYILELDPAKYGHRPIELLFGAPGYAQQRHSVLV